jgi:hypothetical protein
VLPSYLLIAFNCHVFPFHSHVVLVTCWNATLACIHTSNTNKIRNLYFLVFIAKLMFMLLSFSISFGVQIHELTMKLALQKSQNTQLRSQFEGFFAEWNSFNYVIVFSILLHFPSTL